MRRSWCIAALTLIILVLGNRSSYAQAKKVLMISDTNAAWHLDSEVELANYLETIGYSVTIQNIGDMAGEAFADDQKALAAQFDVVYLGDSIGSVTISQGDFEGSQFFIGELGVPIISQEAYMWDEALWVGRDRFTDFGDTFQALEEGVAGAYTDLQIADPSHPMAAGLSGKVPVYTDPYGFNFGYTPTMGKGAKVIATVPNQPDHPVLFVYEKGAALVDGSKSPGMRIGMYIGQNVAREDLGGDGTNNRFDRLTDAGKKLVRAAFDYATGSIATVPGDFDGDGSLTALDIDALSAEVLKGTNAAKFNLNGDNSVNEADRDVWVNTLKKTYYGDANLDGVFNSTDFIAVFQAGQYEDTTANNSGWATGDWNGDKEFNSSDFVTAFQAGGYEAGPRPAVSSVPEPAISLLGFMGLLACRGRARRR